MTAVLWEHLGPHLLSRARACALSLCYRFRKLRRRCCCTRNSKGNILLALVAFKTEQAIGPLSPKRLGNRALAGQGIGRHQTTLEVQTGRQLRQSRELVGARLHSHLAQHQRVLGGPGTHPLQGRFPPAPLPCHKQRKNRPLLTRSPWGAKRQKSFAVDEWDLCRYPCHEGCVPEWGWLDQTLPELRHSPFPIPTSCDTPPDHGMCLLSRPRHV